MTGTTDQPSQSRQPYKPVGLVVEVQWHGPDHAFAAGFLRDGQPWTLNGSLTGMASTPGDAVTALIRIADHLVIHSQNYLTEGPISLADREWLFSLLDPGSVGGERYAAIMATRRAATDITPVRAKDVMIAKVQQARCHRADCTAGPDGGPWRGEAWDTYHEANTEREAHLDWHRAEQARALAAGAGIPDG